MNFKSSDGGRTGRASRLVIASLAGAISLLHSLAAPAVEPIDPVRVCRALADNKRIRECNMAINNVPVDPLAAGACLRLQINYKVGMCMRTIAGMQYSPDEIEECDDLTNVWGTIQCFYRKGTRIANRNFSGTLADQICPRLVTPRQVELCTAVFQENYIQPSAAMACDRFKASNQTIDCLAAIMDERYSEAEVEACDNLETSTETIACFKRQMGGSDPNVQPAPPPPQYYDPPPPRPRYNPPPQGQGTGGCNSYGCYSPGGGCNSYGCYSAGGGCNSYGCYKPGGGCNSYGCYGAYGGCNSYGCWRNGGGCNSYGCWHTSQGACNSYGCSPAGACNSYGCPKLR